MKKSVLIIDDDKWLADTFRVVLHAHQWQVKVCHDPHHAVDVIDEFPPSVILLDMMLPHTNAFALLHELQSHEDTRAIPVVLCSGMTIVDDVSKYGVVALLDKATLTPDELVATLDKSVYEAS